MSRYTVLFYIVPAKIKVKTGISEQIYHFHSKTDDIQILEIGISAHIYHPQHVMCSTISLKWYIFRYTNFTEQVTAKTWYIS